MAFGLANQTRKAFVRISVFGINLAAGWFEEVSLNITQANPANAMDVVPDIPDGQILAKKVSYSAGSALASLVVKDKIVEIISGATFTALL